jgi:hypothetical protein
MTTEEKDQRKTRGREFNGKKFDEAKDAAQKQRNEKSQDQDQVEVKNGSQGKGKGKGKEDGKKPLRILFRIGTKESKGSKMELHAVCYSEGKWTTEFRLKDPTQTFPLV